MIPEPLVEDIQTYAQNIVDTVREPLLILDATLRVQSANRAFYQTFHVSPGETEGRLIYELGNGQWDIPDLRTLLEDIVPTSSVFDDFELEHTFPAIGRRVMLLNARKLQAGHHGELLVLAMEDVTESNYRRLTAEAVRQVARPVVFSVLIILLVYLPLLSLEGTEGKMFRPMATTMALALGGVVLGQTARYGSGRHADRERSRDDLDVEPGDVAGRVAVDLVRHRVPGLDLQRPELQPVQPLVLAGVPGGEPH